MIANGIADSFINTALQRRYEASAYARNFLERQINKTRGDLERSERSLVAYAQAQGIINTGSSRDRRHSRRAMTLGRCRANPWSSSTRRWPTRRRGGWRPKALIASRWRPGRRSR